LLLLPILEAQDVKAEFNKQEDFSRFKTYSWADQPYTRPLLVMHIKGCVDEQLQARGVKYTETGADLIISAYGAVDYDMSVSFSPETYVMPDVNGPVWTGGVVIPGNSTSVLIKKGTLVVDIADPHAKQLKWRGIAKMDIHPHKQKKALEQIDKSVAKMFRNYPVPPVSSH